MKESKGSACVERGGLGAVHSTTMGEDGWRDMCVRPWTLDAFSLT